MTDRFCLTQNPNSRWFSRWLPGFLILALSLTSVQAADPAPSATDMKAVLERLAKLEAEVASLRTQLAEKNAAPAAATVAGTATAAVPGTAAGTTLAVAKPAEKKTFEVEMVKGVKGILYGFAQLDMAYDTGKMNNGNLALWVNSDALNSHDSQWILTGNVSRLGLDLSGADTDTLKLTGKIEADFLGGGGTENNSTLRMRHAYVNALWTETNISLLAGQTWDLNSSLIPPVLNPGLLWYAGNLGMRHPQLRLTKVIKLNETDQVELAVAAARNIGESNSVFAGKDIAGNASTNTDPGKDAQMPTIQYRAAYSRPLWVEKVPAMVAISGHYGQEEWDLDNAGNDTVAKTYSTSLELSLPVTSKLTFTSELFTGANLDDYGGGIGQGVTQMAGPPNDVKSIKARGGWLALKYQANAKTVLALGVAQDDPNDADLAANTRSRNSVAFINIQRNLTTNLKLGLELSQWETDYKNNARGDDTRIQSVVNYSF